VLAPAASGVHPPLGLVCIRTKGLHSGPGILGWLLGWFLALSFFSLSFGERISAIAVLLEFELLATSLAAVGRAVSQGVCSQRELLVMYKVIRIETDIPSWWQCVPPTF
jgi:hypothetical protein